MRLKLYYVYLFLNFLNFEIKNSALSRAGMKKWGADHRNCGTLYPLPDGNASECNPDGSHPCCMYGQYCGYEADYCTCSWCTDFRDVQKWRDEG